MAGLGSMCNVANQCALTVIRADGLLQALGECRRLATELRRGTWQVRQVRQQQHAWTATLVGQLAKQEFPARQSISMEASADTSKHVQQTCRSRTSSMLADMCRRPHAMLCDLVIKGFFSSAPSAYQNCLACTASLVAATRDFRTARQSSCVL